jgi:hypothetical protein
VALATGSAMLMEGRSMTQIAPGDIERAEAEDRD